MKPEPLKNKQKELGSALPKEDRTPYYESIDVKSACELAKIRLNPLTKENSIIANEWIHDKKSTLSFKSYIIEKTFEDVYK